MTRWKPGDRVITLLNQAHLYGPTTPETLESGLGGSLDGTLREYGIFNEQGLVRAPRNLSYAEASTLCCAGVTSWNALYGLKPLLPGQTVLVLGSGGVSLFALQVSYVHVSNFVSHPELEADILQSSRRRPELLLLQLHRQPTNQRSFESLEPITSLCTATTRRGVRP